MHNGSDNQNHMQTTGQMYSNMDDIVEMEREENRIVTEMMADFLCNLDDLPNESLS